MAINKISNSKKEQILRKTAFSLPDNPSDLGMTPSQIKQAFYKGFIDNNNSITNEIDRIVEESNLELSLKQTKEDENLLTESKDIVGAINEIKTKVGSDSTNIDDLLSLKQNITDETLKTTFKTIPSAINELKSSVDYFQQNVDSKLSRNIAIPTYNSVSQEIETKESKISNYGNLETKVAFSSESFDNNTTLLQTESGINITINTNNTDETKVKNFVLDITGIYEDSSLLINQEYLSNELAELIKDVYVDTGTNKLVFELNNGSTKSIDFVSNSSSTSSGVSSSTLSGSYYENGILYLKVENDEFIEIEIGNTSGGSSYTAGEGIVITDSVISLDSTILDEKEDKLDFRTVNGAGANLTINISNNKVMKYGNVGSIVLNTSSATAEDFVSIINFQTNAGFTFTLASGNENIIFRGEDCYSNNFEPLENKLYEMFFWRSTLGMVCYVIGQAL